MPLGGSKVIYMSSSLLFLNCSCRNGHFQLCQVWGQLLQQKLCWQAEERASDKAGGLLCVWYYIPPIKGTLLLRSCKVSYILHHSLSFGHWTFEWPSQRSPPILLLSVLLIKHSILLFFLSEKPEVKYFFADNDLWDWPYVWNNCQRLNCIIQGPNHLEESDSWPLDFCSICLCKLQVAIGFKIAERYKVENKEEPWFC